MFFETFVLEHNEVLLTIYLHKYIVLLYIEKTGTQFLFFNIYVCCTRSDFGVELLF